MNISCVHCNIPKDLTLAEEESSHPDEDIPTICNSDAFVTPDLTQDDASITQQEVHIGPIT
jgi:hypothetical protein